MRSDDMIDDQTTGSFTSSAWQRIAPIREKIDALPLLAKLSDGTLSGEVFRHYILQDTLYLNNYARCLAIVAAKAPDNAQVMRFLNSAQKAIQVEQGLHSGILARFGVTPDDVAVADPPPERLCLHKLLDGNRLSLLLRSGAFRHPPVLLDLLECRGSDQRPAGRDRQSL